MTIVNSSYAQDAHAQPGGSRYVVETHTDSTGKQYTIGPYLAPIAYDIDAALASNAARLAEILARVEFNTLIKANAWTAPVHQTPAEFANRFWTAVIEAFDLGAKERYGRLIWWLNNRVQAGDLSSTDVRNSFNTAFNRTLNASQWNAFVTSRLMPIRDRYQATLDEGAL